MHQYVVILFKVEIRVDEVQMLLFRRVVVCSNVHRHVAFGVVTIEKHCVDVVQKTLIGTKYNEYVSTLCSRDVVIVMLFASCHGVVVIIMASTDMIRYTV